MPASSNVKYQESWLTSSLKFFLIQTIQQIVEIDKNTKHDLWQSCGQHLDIYNK